LPEELKWAWNCLEWVPFKASLDDVLGAVVAAVSLGLPRVALRQTPRALPPRHRPLLAHPPPLRPPSLPSPLASGSDLGGDDLVLDLGDDLVLDLGEGLVLDQGGAGRGLQLDYTLDEEPVQGHRLTRRGQ